MPNVIKTSKGRILDLPVCIKEIMNGENIIATNAPGGRLYVYENAQKNECLADASLLETEEDCFRYIAVPLIEDIQERDMLSLSDKLKHISGIEKRYET